MFNFEQRGGPLEKIKVQDYVTSWEETQIRSEPCGTLELDWRDLSAFSVELNTSPLCFFGVSAQSYFPRFDSSTGAFFFPVQNAARG